MCHGEHERTARNVRATWLACRRSESANCALLTPPQPLPAVAEAAGTAVSRVVAAPQTPHGASIMAGLQPPPGVLAAPPMFAVNGVAKDTKPDPPPRPELLSAQLSKITTGIVPQLAVGIAPPKGRNPQISESMSGYLQLTAGMAPDGGSSLIIGKTLPNSACLDGDLTPTSGHDLFRGAPSAVIFSA
jgi:hypothetical protein